MKDHPKKWYQTAWNVIKKIPNKAYKAIVSNSGALIISSTALALGIVTGGIAPIAIASVILGVKLVKTGLDAYKATKTRDLDIENTALVDFATALYVQQKTLDLQPKLKSTTKNLKPLALDRDGKKLTYDKSFDRVHKIVGVINAGLDIAVVAIDPSKVMHAAKHIKTGIETVEKVKNSIEMISAGGEIISSFQAKKELGELFSKHPEIQEQLVNLINGGRGSEGASYLNLEEVRQQTQTIKNENQALVTTLKEDNFYKLTPVQISDNFKDNLKKISNNSLPAPKKETVIRRMWHGIKNALNPYSEYHPDVQKHSGLTKAVRKENIKSPVIKENPVIKDDFELNKRTAIKTTIITKKQRQKDLKSFKKDAHKLNTRLVKKANIIGEVIHSEGHSQSLGDSDSTSRTIKKQKNIIVKSR
jgi:hypothetical protein